MTRTGEGTTLSPVMRLVAEAQASRSRFQVLADRAAFWLVIVAVGVAVPTFFAWGLFGAAGISFAVARTVTVLVIACHHALGLAIPLVIVAGNLSDERIVSMTRAAPCSGSGRRRRRLMPPPRPARSGFLTHR